MRRLVAMHGTKKWSVIAQSLEGRLGKQCRERWYNHLDPAIKRGPWTEDEDRRIITLQVRARTQRPPPCGAARDATPLSLAAPPGQQVGRHCHADFWPVRAHSGAARRAGLCGAHRPLPHARTH